MCLIAIAVSVVPGWVQGLFWFYLILVVLGVPAFSLTFLIMLGMRLHQKRQPLIDVSWPLVMLTMLVVVLGYASVKFYLPRRLAFTLMQPAYDAEVASAPVSKWGEPLGKRLGGIYIDEYAADPRGGVYFRTATGSDGIGPDVMSYGFTYRPNPEGTPFGAKSYVTRPLGDGWYWFRASDDWY